MEIESIKKHIRDRKYMSGIERDKTRVKSTGEIFSKEWLARESLDKVEQFDPTAFSDPTKTFCDPACGDGNLISEALIRKLENGIDFETALSGIYGVDLMLDNIKLCQDRLLCGQEHLRHIVERNIVCHDALTYDYSFNGTNFTEKELLDQILFEST